LRIAWASDLHLDQCSLTRAGRFYQDVIVAEPHILVVCGDIAEGPLFGHWLDDMAEAMAPLPIAFVLGNHDAYYDSIPAARTRARHVAQSHKGLHWLGGEGVLPLTEHTALVGVDGWADARYGNPHAWFGMRDYAEIADFVGLRRTECHARMRQLGDEAAARLRELLDEALPRFDEVVVVTHVPPFAEAARFDGGPADETALPHFTCKAVGEALLSMAMLYPDKCITVLCGHTHERAEVQVWKNLLVRVAHAQYGQPELQPVLEVP